VHQTRSILSAHPRGHNLPADLLECLRACRECATTCTICADACMVDHQPRLRERCIRLNLDCAAICEATAEILARATAPVWTVLEAQLEACIAACAACAAECDHHSTKLEHCGICAEACREGERACRIVLAGTNMGGTGI
jgi:hypothetical protein